MHQLQNLKALLLILKNCLTKGSSTTTGAIVIKHVKRSKFLTWVELLKETPFPALKTLADTLVSGKLKLSNSANLKVSTYSSVFSSELHILRSFL
jgi:hypothetical protein